MLVVCVLLVHAHCSNWRERDGVRHNLWNMSWVRFELMILWWNPVRGFLVIAVTWACTCCIGFICSVGLIAWDRFTVCDTNLTSLLHFIYLQFLNHSVLPSYSGGSLSRVRRILVTWPYVDTFEACYTKENWHSRRRMSCDRISPTHWDLTGVYCMTEGINTNT